MSPPTARWRGDEKADDYAAARRAAPCSCDDVSEALLKEASLSHMSRSATEARSRASSEQVSSHVRKSAGTGPFRERPPSPAQAQQKEFAGRYYQFLSGHESLGSYLKDKLNKVDSDRCWFCDTGERQSRFHPVARCPAWAGQA